MKIAEKIHEYNINHDAQWLRDVCSLMRTSSEIAKKNDFDKGWNDALTRVIGIIEDGMIPPKDEAISDYPDMPISLTT